MRPAGLLVRGKTERCQTRDEAFLKQQRRGAAGWTAVPWVGWLTPSWGFVLWDFCLHLQNTVLCTADAETKQKNFTTNESSG